MEFLLSIALFAAKAIVIVVSILIILIGFFALINKGKALKTNKLTVKHLNHSLKETKMLLEQEILDKTERKQKKQLEKSAKKQKKSSSVNTQKTSTQKKRVYVLNFDGDIKASQADQLSQAISAIVSLVKPDNKINETNNTNKTSDNNTEVVLKLTSPGGMVHGYGYAAAQLDRIKQHNIPLTIAIDKVAASGGYMMACVADKIIAAPFALIGSIGAVIQIPNFHKWLKKHDIDFEQLTAGEYKRTLTMFGENTDKGRAKMQTELDTAHQLFKQFIQMHRPQVDLTQVATGEHWFASQAIDYKLVDELSTSDAYLLELSRTADIYQLEFQQKKSLLQKITGKTQALFRQNSTYYL